MRQRPYRRRWPARTSHEIIHRPSRHLRPAMLVVVLVAGLSFAYVWQGHRLWQLTALVHEAQQTVTEAHAINQVLRLRIEEAFSLERIARLARDRLGMAAPSPNDILYVELVPPPVH